MRDKTCKFCSEPVPDMEIYLTAQIAIERGYCSWVCLSMDLGHEVAMRIIKDEGVLEEDN